ncbi:hypothetical protein [Streptomyces siamensis]|uniref:Uncharacterized protein n=1 Tax=Streptomyces siamensis TaxID=1274986 RepID=A0ABP9JEX8_9ACTN
MFEADPGSGPATYYAVEVATSAELFDWANHESEHTTDNHYASRDDTGFLASNPYQLPDEAWQRLNAAETLYYRPWFSSSDSEWVDQAVTTTDDSYWNAPYVTIPGTAADNDWWTDTRWTRDDTVEQHETAQPLIIGPDSAEKDGPAPTFHVELPDGARSYRAEFATEASLFDAVRMRQGLPNNFFGSLVTDAKGGFDYTLPDDAWGMLTEESSHLYYRVHTAPIDSSAPDWHPQASSTPDAMAEQAPWVMAYTVE